MVSRENISACFSVALCSLLSLNLSAEPSYAPLLPVFALSDGSAGLERVIYPTSVDTDYAAPSPASGGGAGTDVFALALTSSGQHSVDASFAFDTRERIGGLFPTGGEVIGADGSGEIRGQDTRVQTEIRTFVQEGDSRLPASWSVPPGGSAPGGGVPGDYQGQYPHSSYAPGGGYYPDGPYSYRYDGVLPFDGGGLYGPGPYSGSHYDDSSFEFEGGIPLFIRNFNPDDAHFKAGNFYFQALWVETGALYSDYHGPAAFRPGEEDGFLGFASFRFRVAAQITPSLYLAADGELIYLFGENELGFRSGLEGGPFARLEYRRQYGAWDLLAYAEFGTGSLQNLYGSDAFEQAGRYSFGFLGYNDQSSFAYDPFLYSRLGAEATTLVNPEWRLTLSADHTDFWYVGDDRADDHDARENLRVLYGAEPNTVPFSPWFSYDLWSDDQFDTNYQTVYAGGSGRLSQDVTMDARVGYLWSTGLPTSRESWLWNIGLNHRINSRTTHGVRFGQDYFLNDFSIDTTVSSFFQYYITHEVTERLRLHAFAQWSSDEFLSGPLQGGEFERETFGARASYQISDRVSSDVGYLVEYSENSRTGAEAERSLLDANLNWLFGSYSTAYLRYQHEDTDIFYEDLYMAGARRHF